MDPGSVQEAAVDRMREALADKNYTSGSTHNFYHYPARFSPAIARAVIETFTSPGEVVLDPFMGGGTTVIEALALGRRAIGADLNALAHFVTTVRTTPLSRRDVELIMAWADKAATLRRFNEVARLPASGAVNIPRAVELFMTEALAHADALPLPRQRAFARCVLLRLGQWSMDCRDFVSPRRRLLARQLPVLVREMVDGLNEFVATCAKSAYAKNDITRNRSLVHCDSADLPSYFPDLYVHDRPRLVFTSPPYPGVHVLYHRWQYRGRKETSAPYWIADVPDGFGGAYYTAGSRTPSGLDKFFATITNVFTSLRSILAHDTVVVQLVGFNDVATQLPRYLNAMGAAGFNEYVLGAPSGARLGRRVPNRKWYAKLKGEVDASAEIMLIHRPVSSTTKRPPSPSPGWRPSD